MAKTPEQIYEEVVDDRETKNDTRETIIKVATEMQTITASDTLIIEWITDIFYAVCNEYGD
ncbi:hypothetical protein LCGC14_1831860 [marine sediment metagenome]|uniref:Uncharacterized protein n=1 Tax=marine sediment metagenome TaxID=412755 RepID=A0A0F9GG41_9ZZZZ